VGKGDLAKLRIWDLESKLGSSSDFSELVTQGINKLGFLAGQRCISSSAVMRPKGLIYWGRMEQQLLGKQ
jgi:hypothetical protein